MVRQAHHDKKNIFDQKFQKKEVMSMCPEFKHGICELAGIEPDEIKCTSEDCCLSNEWERCKVYISQFFLASEKEFLTAA
jgi:predicted nucleic acid-binding Zn ribbon protein